MNFHKKGVERLRKDQYFNICVFGIRFGLVHPSEVDWKQDDLGLQCSGRFSRWKEDTEPKASTTIYIFVSLSEMPCSWLYIPIPVSNFSSE